MDVKPGETAQVVIGGGGRTVVGRIEIIGQNFLPHWATELQTLVRVRPDLTPPKMQAAEDFAVFARALTKYERQVSKYYFGVRNDGSFVVDDVAPGTYLLEVHFSEPPEDPLDQEWVITHNPIPVVSLTREVVVPESIANPSSEPFDVGTLSVLVSDAPKTRE